MYRSYGRGILSDLIFQNSVRKREATKPPLFILILLCLLYILICFGPSIRVPINPASMVASIYSPAPTPEHSVLIDQSMWQILTGSYQDALEIL